MTCSHHAPLYCENCFSFRSSCQLLDTSLLLKCSLMRFLYLCNPLQMNYYLLLMHICSLSVFPLFSSLRVMLNVHSTIITYLQHCKRLILPADKQGYLRRKLKVLVILCGISLLFRTELVSRL